MQARTIGDVQDILWQVGDNIGMYMSEEDNMPYLEDDLKREVLIACNKARADMRADEIKNAINEVLNNAELFPPDPQRAASVEGEHIGRREKAHVHEHPNNER